MHAAWLAFARYGDPGWHAYDDTCRSWFSTIPEGDLRLIPRGDERRIWPPG